MVVVVGESGRIFEKLRDPLSSRNARKRQGRYTSYTNSDAADDSAKLKSWNMPRTKNYIIPCLK